MIWPVIILWVFAVGLIIMGAFHKTPVQLIQNRLDDFEPNGGSRSVPVMSSLFDAPRKAREPVLKAILTMLARLGAPLSQYVPTIPNVQNDLTRAGNPHGLGPVEFLGVKLLGGAIGFIIPLVLAAPISKLNPSAPLMLTVVVAMMGWTAPTLWIKKLVRQRRLDMKVALPDILDLIILSMDAGIGFDGALGRAIEKTKGSLTDEMTLVLNEINHGKSRSESFRDMATRARLEDLSLLLAAINQSEQLGTSIGQALKIQAKEIRRRRTQELREMAAKLPVKMLIPLVLCIFPSLLLVILGPAGILLLSSGVLGGN
ncbi:MAG: hypothetical protein AUJ92_06660 [Armatimonadetes bacterium CG2_30_59_28]|nr:type II secretion system F family protein [Armatimonadota bacterium]OIO96127.1 MAG: hypothetical protein AUJ92_06660 [Armatimonadetes bacterium CG2_30_59_28]PIU63036.1 MAG: hypothetical protein COS85_16870 [Armatimonadetes bacterium CG07_land_8_20_14_0_80_59_28]PIX43754.1 MAG: hypothetical protein COZ56_06435 [Armatimonadetes bacterium CG_4_8_14_3_um_filter_58_9]PJB66205.1 MAG: hypothetical protein CO095_13255 [Armatimonadetes bacterium CG_4_9_14_3_um_filter_58_7]